MAYTRTTLRRENFSRSYTYNGAATDKSITVLDTDIKSGSRVERYKDKIKAGSPAGSDYSRTAWRYESRVTTYRCKAYYATDPNIKYDLQMNGVMNPGQAVTSLDVSSPEIDALSKLYQKIKEKQEGMNGLLVLGEIRETIKMLRRPGEGLLSLFNDYLGTAKGIKKEFASKKAGSHIKRANKALSDLWLEVQFGWKPLISDCQDAATTVARIVYDNALRTDRARSMRVNSKADTPAPTPIDQSFFPSTLTPTIMGTVVNETEKSCKYVAGIKASTSGPVDSFSAVAKETGLTLDNFVPTVWNLLPYSFLVDYFTNVGDCIDAVFTDISGVNWYVKSLRTVDTSYLSSRVDLKQSALIMNQNGWAIDTMGTSDGFLKKVRTSLIRTTGTILPVPTLEFSLPAVDSTKYWNLYALFCGNAAGVARR